ncbi:SAVED domain-containing protein [Brevibacillus borstelensis]|uniref:SAVED domain-containing protein n=1 Tax=Brevibacillus borstelensis TaxID=45462 RepID=UPI00203BBDAA|nr:SAVED domain-containing protein [Brevibacillus borstelensis]MCM3623690.1 SAVED domain-containing protein [Brevibacillus borstelensis]
MEKAKVWFRDWHDKKIAMMLIGTGCTSILGSFATPWWLNPFIQLVNERLHTNIKIPDSSVDYVVMIAGLIVGIILIRWGIKYRQRTKTKNKKMVQVRHASVEVVNYTKIHADLDDYEVVPLTINQFQEMNEITEFNLKMAWKKQEHIVFDLLVHINDPSTNEIVYMGLAHIPFQFLLGYQVADKTSVRFFEWSRTELAWKPLKEGNDSFPEMVLLKNEKQAPDITEEIVIKVGITYEIFDWQLEGHGLENVNIYYLKLDPPRLDAITSVEQINKYKQQFRDLLTEIHHMYPKLRKVHIFFSGQPSLAYKFGSSISARMDSNKEFWVYHYVGSSPIKYPWALRLSKELKDDSFKIVLGEKSNADV